MPEDQRPEPGREAILLALERHRQLVDVFSDGDLLSSTVCCCDLNGLVGVGAEASARLTCFRTTASEQLSSRAISV